MRPWLHRLFRRRPASVTPVAGQARAGQVAATADDLRAILNGLPAMIGYWDADQRNRMGNQAYLEYFGVSPDELPGTHIRDLLGPELYAQNLPYIKRALAGEAQLFDRKLVDTSGGTRYTQASYIPDVVGGRTRGFFVLVTDITERRAGEAALQQAERRFRTLFDVAPLGMFLVGADGRIIDANQAAAELLGRPREQLLGHSTLEFTHPDDVAASTQHRRALAGGDVESFRLEKRYLRPDGTPVWVQLDARLLSGSEDDDEIRMLGQIQDIGPRRRQQEALERMAAHDALTGLRNRRGLMEDLDRECARVNRYGDPGALLIVDLDHFKAVNDTFGHQAGDEALVQVGKLLQGRLRETDTVARHGGDEFAIILPHTTAEEAERVATDLVDQIRVAHLGAPGTPITASVGVAPLRAGARSSDALADADLTMYRVKDAGGDGLAMWATS
jgi:diguanylate cyclase (GGDEF)-like protein/PAS domain S-box-containing protein